MSSTVPKTELVPWINNLPPDWETYRVDSVADVLFSNVDKHTLDEEVPVLLCNYVDVYRNEKITGAINFMGASAEPREIKRFQLNRGDVLVTKDSETPDDIAITALVSEELPGVLCGYHLAMLRPRSKRICGPYLAWLHSSKQFRAQYEAKAVGVTRFGLPQYAFRSAVIPLPSLPEQERIAAYLDASCTALDSAVAAKRRQLETLEALRSDVIQRVVTRGISENLELKKTGNFWMEEVPFSWDLVCLKRVSKIQTGLTLGKEYEGRLIERPYLRVANVQDGHLALEDVTTIEVPVEVAKRVELQVDDVLMTEGGDLDKLARGYLWNGEISGCLHQNHIFAVRCHRHKLLPKFLTYLTASRYGRDYFESTGKRTTNLASTNATKVGAFPLPLPSVKEQAQLVEYLEEQLDGLRSLANNLQQQISTLLAYRKSLIHECVTGQRRVTEADMARLKNDNSSGMM